MTLLAGGRGNHRQPDDALCRCLTLLGLHVSGVVVLANEGAVVIGPFQYDDLTEEEKEHWESLDWGDEAATAGPPRT